MVKPGKNSMEDWLLFSYIAGKTEPEETRTVDKWLAGDPLNKDRLEHLREIFRYSESLRELEGVDMTGDWNKIRSRIGWPGEQKYGRTINILSLYSFPLLKIAAMIVLIMIPAVLLQLKFDFLGSHRTLMITASAGSGTEYLLLPDGTSVTLNAYSGISYPESFKGRNREVSLTGEAYFNVIRSEKQPFLVYPGNNLVVEVMGTSFTVRSAESTGQAVVRVLSGMVAFYREGQKRDRLVLSEGEMGIHSGDGFSKSAIDDPNFLSWKTGRLEFRNDLFSDVARSLERYSGMTVLIRDEALNGMVLTSAFDHQELEDILEEISLVLNIGYAISNDTIFFYLTGK
jgi:transmembrane sensor